MDTSQITFPLFLAVVGLNVLNIVGCGQAADSARPSSPECDGGAGLGSDVPPTPAARPAPHFDYPLTDPANGGQSGRGEAAPVDDDAAAAATDVIAPYIVSMSPENGALGVRSDTPIVIEFSEAMAAPSVLLAFGSEELPLSQLDATWNGAGTVLTLTPKIALEYAQQALTDRQMLASTAKTYGFRLAPSATDLAGNPLPETSASFSTLRELTHTITATKALTGAVVAENDERGQVFGFVSFDGRTLPPGIRALQRATLHIPPHATHEDVPVVDVDFDELSPAAIAAGPGTPVGILPGEAVGNLPLPANICAYLVRDYLDQGNGPGYSQFRLQLPAAASRFDLQAIDGVLDQTSLELVYLLP